MEQLDRGRLAAVTLPEELSGELRAELEESGRPVRLEAGSAFVREGDPVESFALVGEGMLRVYKSGPAGREITLYTVGRGELCMLNVLCLLSGRPSPASVFAEAETHALVYRRRDFLRWIADHEDMRRFVFATLADRVDNMMTQIEEVAFQRMDQRLVAYLLERSLRGGTKDVQITHEVIASDLGTAREVVSRLLKSFELRGAVRLGRGRIEVVDPQRLRNLAF